MTVWFDISYLNARLVLFTFAAIPGTMWHSAVHGNYSLMFGEKNQTVEQFPWAS